ncbi:hypothetical protein Z043_110457, partial [Scleropages formosus]
GDVQSQAAVQAIARQVTWLATAPFSTTFPASQCPCALSQGPLESQVDRAPEDPKESRVLLADQASLGATGRTGGQGREVCPERRARREAKGSGFRGREDLRDPQDRLEKVDLAARDQPEGRATQGHLDDPASLAPPVLLDHLATVTRTHAWATMVE